MSWKSLFLQFYIFIFFLHCLHLKCHQSLLNSTAEYFPDCVISYPLNPESLCEEVTPSLIIAVHSSPYNVLRRQLIRNSFGSFKTLSKQRILVMFIVGEVNNVTLQKQLSKEKEENEDLIQANFYDSYHNLTLKHVALLNWVDRFCNSSKYFVKIDDDVMVNVFHLVYFLENYPMKSDFICKAIYVRVNRVGKWAVSRSDFQGDEYPVYCEGFMYVFSKVSKLSEVVAESLRTEYFWIDDVFISGIVRDQLNLTIDYLPTNFGFTDINFVTERDLSNFMLFRNEKNDVNESTWYKVWTMILRISPSLYLGL